MKLEVQIVSDVVCPWCYIGKANWDKGSKLWMDENPGNELEVEMKPFRLDPTIPMEGRPRDEVLAAKFGSLDQMNAIFSRTKNAAAQSGIQMEFLSGIQQPNTLHSHRLIRFAKDYGLQEDMAYALFEAYFSHNKDLTKQDILHEITLAVGIPEDRLVKFWELNEYLEETIQEETNMRALGVTGVPFYVINEKYAFSGAQPPEVMKNILSEILEKEKSSED
jgi:predicted DsbA family dithiol-disulfide isomerase